MAAAAGGDWDWDCGAAAAAGSAIVGAAVGVAAFLGCSPRQATAVPLSFSATDTLIRQYAVWRHRIGACTSLARP